MRANVPGTRAGAQARHIANAAVSRQRPLPRRHGGRWPTHHQWVRQHPTILWQSTGRHTVHGMHAISWHRSASEGSVLGGRAESSLAWLQRAFLHRAASWGRLMRRCAGAWQGVGRAVRGHHREIGTVRPDLVVNADALPNSRAGRPVSRSRLQRSVESAQCDIVTAHVGVSAGTRPARDSLCSRRPLFRDRIVRVACFKKSGARGVGPAVQSRPCPCP